MPDSDIQPVDPSIDEPSGLVAFFYHRRQRLYASPLDTCLEIGRQREGEPVPPARVDQSDGARIILAPLDDVEISRSHLQIAPTTAGHIRIANRSQKLPVRLSPDRVLAPGESAVAAPPLLIQFGPFAVGVDPPEDDDLALAALPHRTIPPGSPVEEQSLELPEKSKLDDPALLRWLETVLDVFQSCACSQEFPEQAARAVVRIVGLDTAAMIQFTEEDRWRVAAMHSLIEDQDKNTWVPSQTLLNRVRKERRTFRHVPSTDSATPHSLQNVTALVAAPILDATGKVTGALYGDRRRGDLLGTAPDISPFEAKLVELLASGIAAGLARIKEQQAAIAARVRFEQFFTPQLAAQLESDPELLIGRDAEVTLLFADIRSFSKISEQLGPERTMAWIQDTMGVLSDCVLQCDGVLVDYLGDELMAMWGAPAAQSDHADLACEAASKMLHTLPALTARWKAELGSEVRLGIGINSGIARVGNTGSAQKFKYGPLGDTVNIASRVQGATKYLGADCLFTGNTRAAMQATCVTRRLARVRVVNIKHSIEIFELAAEPPDDWQEHCNRYEETLVALEKNEVTTAAGLAAALVREFPDDLAAEALARRIAESTHQSDPGKTAIWRLPGK